MDGLSAVSIGLPLQPEAVTSDAALVFHIQYGPDSARGMADSTSGNGGGEQKMEICTEQKGHFKLHVLNVTTSLSQCFVTEPQQPYMSNPGQSW